jgi:hypothetical protein
MRFSENRLMSIADYSQQKIEIVSFLLCFTQCGDGVSCQYWNWNLPIACWGNDFTRNDAMVERVGEREEDFGKIEQAYLSLSSM